MTEVTNDVLLAGAKKLAKLAKSGKDRAEKADVQEGLVAAVKVSFPEPQLKGQTKPELGTPPVHPSSTSRPRRFHELDTRAAGGRPHVGHQCRDSSAAQAC